MNAQVCRILMPVLLISSLISCQGTGGYVPVADSGERGSIRNGQRFHVVNAGETLYSIAWRYGLDYRDLARINGISSPYTIFIKQRLSLISKTGSSRNPPASRRTQPAVSHATTRAAPPEPATKTSLSWDWPITGKVVKGFALTGDVNKGVDISGSDGQKVNSAATGIVVYAGGGLRGYGKLVILKHSDNFLSAYGNNSEILVKEGDSVKQGKTIAKLAANGSVAPMLHFEIRRDGKPQNPLNYLPRKK